MLALRAMLLVLMLAVTAHAQPAPDRAAYAAIVSLEAERRGLPPALAHAVAIVESGWDPAARGADGEVGLMQVMPATAALLGFNGTLEQLADPATNIRLGVEYLSAAWFLARGDLCTALMKYRAGHGEDAMSPKSVEYCARVRAYLAAVGSPLAAAAAVPVAASRTRPRAGPRGPVSSEAFWARWDRRVHGRRARVAASQ